MELSFAGAVAERSSWTAGETVTGELLISSRSAVTTRSVSVALSGREKVVVETTEVEFELGELKPKLKCRTHVARCTLLNRRAALLGAAPGAAGGAPKLQLDPAGAAAPHRFPFSFKLPPALPGAFSAGGLLSNYGADVRYTLQARVDRPGRFDSTRSLPLPVRGNAVDAAGAARLLQARAHAASASKAFTMSEGRLQASAALPARALLAGGSARLGLRVQNGTGVSIDKVRVKLLTRIKVTAGGHSKSEAGRSLLLAVLSAVSGPAPCRAAAAGAGQSAKVELELRLPPDCETTHGSARLCTTHALQVELVPRGWLHMALVVELPVDVLAAVAPAAAAAAAAAVAAEAGAGAGAGAAAGAAAAGGTDATADDVRVALAEVGGSPSSTTKKGHTALHLACLRGHGALCRLLLAAGCSAEQPTHAGFTPLHSAAFGGDALACVAVMEAALARGGAEGLARLRAQQTGKGSSARSLAEKDIAGHSAAAPELAKLIESWAPKTPGVPPSAGEAGAAAGEQGGRGGGAQSDGEEDEEGTERDEAVVGDEGVGAADAAAVMVAASSDDGGGGGGGTGAGAGAGAAVAAAATAAATAAAPQPPPQPRVVQWMTNNASSTCTVCGAAFSLFNRRHHCRGCGTLVCDTCGPKRSSKVLGVGDGAAGKEERMCPSCCA